MKRIFLIASLSILLFSCEKMLFEPDRASSDPFEVFDYLWNEVDKKYSYFELKQIDWDQIRVDYRAQIFEGMSEEALFDVLGSMLNELRDDHSNLFSPFNISRYDVALRNPPNYSRRLVKEFYVPNSRITGAFSHDFIDNGRIGYIWYESFTSRVDAASLDHILERYADTDGLILDLRENGGGNVDNIALILERFASERTLVGYFITRNGPERNSFGPKANFFIGAHKGVTYKKPVMVLIDRGSYSATTMFASATKAFSNIKLIGDTTGGGGGLPNGGQLPNGWIYRFSISQLLDLNENNYAESGVPPDIIASLDFTDLTKDEIIERAIEELR
ncbi:S41 family peptidase [Algoriphagus sp.]|uniref:S41 family peptidase n=1 Tax=Algoriphagus sp. TaxID=1872435 RepID=UPI00391A2E08